MLPELPLECLRLLVSAASFHPPHSLMRERVWQAVELLLEGDLHPAELAALVASLAEDPLLLIGARPGEQVAGCSDTHLASYLPDVFT